jgi:hypothetical protein
MKTLLSAVAALFALPTVACAVDPSTATDQMQVYETCLETECDEMQQSASSECSACESACMSASYDCDPSSACEDSCSSRDCSDTDKSTCEEQGFKVTMPNNPSPDIDAACGRELAHITSCGYSTSMKPSDCTRYAASELPERASNYDCVAQLDCSSLTDDSAMQTCDAPASTFGDDFCGSLATACPSNTCSSDRQAFMNAEGGWARPDALDAARSCLSQPSCDETADCISAWVSAVE